MVVCVNMPGKNIPSKETIGACQTKRTSSHLVQAPQLNRQLALYRRLNTSKGNLKKTQELDKTATTATTAIIWSRQTTDKNTR